MTRTTPLTYGAIALALIFGALFLYLVAFENELVFRLHSFRTPPQIVPVVVMQRSVGKFNSALDKPALFGAFTGGPTVGLHFSTRFKLAGSSNLPNLFQTAAANSGIRFEVSGSTAGIVFGDLTQPGGISGLIVARDLQTNVWYSLDIRARSGSSIVVALDREGAAKSEPIRISTPKLSFATSDIRVGEGFSPARHWDGEFADAHLTLTSDSSIDGSHRIGAWSSTEDTIDLGAADHPDRAYFHLKLQLRASGSDGYPNVFQTDVVNSGIRLEIAGRSAAIVMPDTAVPSNVRALALDSNFQLGQWYTLEVEGQDNGYVKAQFHRVGQDGGVVSATQASRTTRFGTGSILIGAGFSGIRKFQGELRDISITVGRGPPDLRRTQRIVYGLIAAAAILFMLALILALRARPSLQKLAVKVACLGVIIAPCIGYYEFRLAGMNTVYLTKREALESQLGDIEVLTLGSSNTLYGVDPDRFARRGFNLAAPGQSLYYDEKLLAKYLPRLPKLKLVFLGVNFYTFGNNWKTFPQAWREDFYRKYDSIPAENPAHRGLGFWSYAPNFSNLAMFGENSVTYSKEDFRALVDIVCTPSGWFDSGIVSVDDWVADGTAAAHIADLSTSEALYPESASHLRTMIETLKARGIATVILNLPLPLPYRQALDAAKKIKMDEALNRLANEEGVAYANFSDDPRFTEHDFSDLVDHLNAKGADKISDTLNARFVTSLPR